MRRFSGQQVERKVAGKPSRHGTGWVCLYEVGRREISDMGQDKVISLVKLTYPDPKARGVSAEWLHNPVSLTAQRVDQTRHNPDIKPLVDSYYLSP